MLTRKDFLDVLVGGTAGLLSPQSSAAPAPRKLEGEAIKGATEAVRNFILRTTFQTLPAAVVEQGKRCLMDGFGVILAGSTVPGSEIVREYVKAASDRREATILGRKPLGAPASFAALANGASGHAMDYDDTQLSTTPDRTFGLLTHPTMPALSAALAVAERLGASGRRFSRRFSSGSRSSARSPRRSTRLTTPRIPQLGHDRHVRRGRRRGEADEADRRPDRAHAGDRVERAPRHPRQLRIDDQAASRRTRARRTACSRPSWRHAASPAATTGSTDSGGSSRCSAAAPISIG